MKYLYFSTYFFCFLSFICNAQAPIKLSTDQFKFVEGPTWDGQEFIYFSDIPNKKIHKYSIKTGKFQLAFNNKDGCNGLMLDKDNTLVICEIKTGQLTKRKTDGSLVEILSTGFNNIRFDTTNDLCIDNKGGIYFTDPSWRTKPYQPERRIYYLTPDKKTKIASFGGYKLPNGVIISSNHKYLYVNDSSVQTIYRYKIKKDGSLHKKEPFATLNDSNDGDPKSGADGMAIDIEGNLYVTAKKTLQVFNKKGKLIQVINFPEKTTNCIFGGKDKKTLFVTASKNLYAVKLDKTGFHHPFDY